MKRFARKRNLSLDQKLGVVLIFGTLSLLCAWNNLVIGLVFTSLIYTGLLLSFIEQLCDEFQELGESQGRLDGFKEALEIKDGESA